MKKYKNKKLISGLSLVLITTILVITSVVGYPTGINDRAKTGCECHALSADPSVTVLMTGQPPEYTPLSAYTLTITVSGGPVSTQGGFNLEISAGLLSSSDINVQTNLPANQATHTNPNQRSWSVTWTAPSQGTGDVTFWVAGNAVDGNGFNTGDGWNLFSTLVSEAPPPENIITLKEGWNLISLPWIQQDTDLFAVLESIDGKYDAVQWFNNSDIDDPWKHYKEGKISGNDLTQLDEKMGFWVQITQSGDTVFMYNGTEPSVNQTISLYSGWNLVGYPSLGSKIRNTALNNLQFTTEVDLVQTFNSTTGSWEELGEFDYFEKGRGYWIHSKVDKVWDVPL
jgi:hypothetical protein